MIDSPVFGMITINENQTIEWLWSSSIMDSGNGDSISKDANCNPSDFGSNPRGTTTAIQ